jgi:hypothetical protein
MKYTLAEWRAEGVRRGGGDLLDARFRCPLCQHVASPRDFQAAGADPNRAAMECIGRVIGARGGMRVERRPGQAMPQPCDWAAFGLFGTLNKGVEVEMESGNVVWAFAFADDARDEEKEEPC